MGCSRIKQNFNEVITDRECTRQHCRSLWDVNQGGEVEFALFDLHHRFLALVPLTET
jgi:hypothetical protein